MTDADLEAVEPEDEDTPAPLPLAAKVRTLTPAELAEIRKQEADRQAAAQQEARQKAAKALVDRHEMSDADLADCWRLAAESMTEALSKEAENHLSDLLASDERIIYKIRSSPKGERSQLALTDRALYIFSKGIAGGQAQDMKGLLGTLMAIGLLSVRIYPIKSISIFELQPIHGVTVGHLQVLGAGVSEDDNETKFLLDSKLGYFKAVLVYRKLLELQRSGHQAACLEMGPKT